MIQPASDRGGPASDETASARNIVRAGAALAFFVSFVVYVRTMEASASFWDAGEFIAAAHTLGIPHSPGTPLYVLVAKAFSLLPIWFMGVAQKVNLLSAFCGAAGVLFAYLISVRFVDAMLGSSRNAADALVRATGALVGVMFLAFSDTYWANATEAEVYAMSNALMGLMTWLALRWGEGSKDNRSTSAIYLLFYLLAMSVGFHLGTVLAFSGIFFYILGTRERPFTTLEFLVACMAVGIFLADATIYRDGRVTVFFLIVFVAVLLWIYSARSPFAVVASLLFILGLSVHLYLLIRSGHNPNIDEGDPETWRSLYAVLRREQYPPTNVVARKADFLFQLKHFNGYFQAQFQMASAYISQLNLGSILPIGLGIWGIVDHFSKHRRTFVMLFVTLVVVSLGLVVFLNFSDAEVRERDYFYSPAFYYFAVYIAIGASSLLNELRNLIARGATQVTPVIAGACIVFLAMPLFTLKHNFFTHDRSNNRTCPVYARNMLGPLEPNAIIFTNGDNDTFPLWYIQEVEEYRTDVRVVNLSLLNTPWYIKQCRDLKPSVPISWDDTRINQLQPVPGRDGWLLVRDLAVQHILQTNKFQRPIYFAVTIPPSTYAPYREYLEMEGLVYLVVPRKGQNMINVSRLENNLSEVYDFDGILTEDWKRDESLYLPQHTEHLIQNYAAAFAQLAYIKHQDGLYDEALKYMEAAGQISPQMQPPQQMLGVYYLDVGDTTRAIDFYLDRLRANPDDLASKFRLAGVYEQLGRYEESAALLRDLVFADPTDGEIMLMAFSMSMRAGRIAEARQYLVDWLRVNPADSLVRETLADVDRQISGNVQNPGQ